jgi:hypothetical protein
MLPFPLFNCANQSLLRVEDISIPELYLQIKTDMSFLQNTANSIASVEWSSIE